MGHDVHIGHTESAAGVLIVSKSTFLSNFLFNAYLLYIGASVRRSSGRRLGGRMLAMT